MNQQIYSALPELVSGFAQDRYEVKFVRPRVATNLITNPSFEIDTTGYAAFFGTIARTTDKQRRGAHSAIVTPTSSLFDGIVFTGVDMTLSTTYYVSVDVWAQAGLKYRLVVDVTGGTYNYLPFVGIGRWERIKFAVSASLTGNHVIAVTKDDSANLTPFYVDGFQVETDRFTSYLDGSMAGFVRNQTAYFWNGAEHASTSTRIAQTRSGGEEIDLADYGFQVQAILGLGGDNFANLSTDNAFLGGAIYERSAQLTSGFDIVGAFTGSLSEIMRNKSDLRKVLRYDAAVVHQPLVMKVRVKDETGDYLSEPLAVHCLFRGGLSGVRDNYNQERTALSFQIDDPYTGRLDGDVGTALDVSDTFTAAYNARRVDGTWGQYSTGFNGLVYHIVHDYDRGYTYFCGAFTTAGGVTVNRICYYAAGQFWAMGAGATKGVDNLCYGMALAPNGDLWAVGAFANVGGTPTSYIARYSPDTDAWTAFPLSVAGTTFFGCAVDNNGLLYAWGGITNWNGDLNNDYLVTYDGATWGTLAGDSFTSDNYPDWRQSGCITRNNHLVIGTTSNAGAGALYRWDGATWTTLGTCNTLGDVFAVVEARDGSIYGGGTMSSIGGVAVSRAFRYNGTTFEALGDGLDSSVWAVNQQMNGDIIYTGGFTGGVSIWTGTIWNPLDIDLPGTPAVWWATEINNDLALGFDTTGTASAPGATTVDNPGSADTHPVITITGPGTLVQIINYTTGDAIYFDLTLLDDEVAVLDLTQGRVRFGSNFRANLLSTILPGSFYNFRLASEENEIRMHIQNGGFETAAQMVFRPIYASLDDTLYRSDD